MDHGEVYYAESRQRVRVEITDELISRTLQIVAAARALAARPVPPPLLR